MCLCVLTPFLLGSLLLEAGGGGRGGQRRGAVGFGDS